MCAWATDPHIIRWTVRHVAEKRHFYAMMLLEHDAKVLLAGNGIPVPFGYLGTADYAASSPSLPFPQIVKAQVAAGGRGKAGGIRRVETHASLQQALREL